MATVEKHAPGSFCWVELATTDGASAKEFYTGLFGWTAKDDEVAPGMVYTMLQRDGKNVGALYQMRPEMQGIPPHWLTYVTVDDVDALVAKAQSLGGKVIREPMDVMEIGRMAVIEDPSGATIAFWQPKLSHGFQICGETNLHCWTELLTNDVAGSKAFYNGIFGWEGKHSQSASNPYTEIYNAGQAIGGILELTPEMGGTPPHWMNYYAVDDCDAMFERAKGLGATACTPVMEIEHVGRFAMLQDPQGAGFSIIHLTHEPM